MDPVQPTTPSQQPTQQVPVQPEGKKFNKWIIVAIVFSALLLGLGGYIVLNKSQTNRLVVRTNPTPNPVLPTQTQDPTANWKTYTNEKYKYIFRFPQEWNLGGNEEATLLYNKPITSNELGYIVEFYPAVTTQNNVQIEDAIGIKKEVGDKIFEEKITDLTIDNKAAAKFRITVLEGSQTDARPAVLVKVKNGDKIFYIKFYGSPQEQNTFEQILSSFKFTN